MKAKIEELVKLMVNKSYLYGTHIHVIKDWDINEDRGRFYMWTDRKGNDPFDRTLDTALVFLNEFREVNNAPAVTNNNNLAGGLMLAKDNLGTTLKEILLDNIEKVKENPDYIPQAEAVKSNVDSILNLAKTEIEYLKVMRKAQEQDF